MFMHLSGNQVGTRGIDRIGESHGKKKRNSDPDLYDFWINSLVKSVKECDTQLPSALEAEWSKVLRSGVDRIVSSYSK